MTEVRRIARQVARRRTAEPVPEPEPSRIYFSTGSTLLNLALSDSANGGTPGGKMGHIVGDSSSGKTILALTLFAEAAHRPEFDHYNLIFDDAEAANEFNMARLFGNRTAERVEPPAGTREEPESSETIQDFQRHVLAALKRGPCIYVLDSFDAITSEEEIEKTNAAIKAQETGKAVAGTYGMEKAKKIGQILRLVIREIKKTQSLLIVISQTRDNINPMSFEKKTHSGGRALKFYASWQIWLAMGQKIRKKERVVGVTCLVKVAKNKLTGKVREVAFPIYYDYGVDDYSAMIDFLLEEKRWGLSGQTINTGDSRFNGTRASLLRKIDEDPANAAWLRAEAEAAWMAVEEELRLERRPRYA